MLPPSQALDLLSSLVDKSLVVYEEDEHGQGRYRLLETVRQYGQDRLAESGEAGAVRERHQDYFLAFAEAAEPELTGPDQKTRLDRLGIEHENLRFTLEGCLADGGDVEAGLRLAGALWRFWEMRDHASEGQQWMRRIVQRAEEAEAAGTPLDPVVRSRTLYGAGILSFNHDTSGSAPGFFNQSLALSRQAGDQTGIAFAVCGLGLWEGDESAAVPLLEKSLTLFRQIGEDYGTALALMGLGGWALHRHDHAAARTLLEEALAIERQRGYQKLLMNSLRDLGRVASAQGDWGTARTLFEQSGTFAQELGYQDGIAFSRHALGMTVLRLGDPAAAQDLFREALRLFRQVDNKAGISETLNRLGELACQQGDQAEARALFGENLTSLQHLSWGEQITDALVGLAGVAQGQNHPLRAARLLGAAGGLMPQHTRSGPEQEKHDRLIASVRAALGEEGFSSAWAWGQAMRQEQAVAYGLVEAGADDPD